MESVRQIVGQSLLWVSDRWTQGRQTISRWFHLLLEHPRQAMFSLWAAFWESWVPVCTLAGLLIAAGFVPQMIGYGTAKACFVISNVLFFVRLCLEKNLHGEKGNRKHWAQRAIITIFFLMLFVPLSIIECGMVSNTEAGFVPTWHNIWIASKWWRNPVAPLAGAVRISPKGLVKYVWIPPGTFVMGCSQGDDKCFPEEKPTHSVTISKGFWIGQTEVTVAAYEFSTHASGLKMPSSPKFNQSWSIPDQPMVNITWDEASAYCSWDDGRLPTEAEWEYAARGKSTNASYGSIDEVAWYQRNSRQTPHVVAQKQANGFGLYDVLGNAWEWVGDWYGETYYRQSPPNDPQGPSGGNERVLRGGSWFNGPELVRLSDRNRDDPGVREHIYGFRCVQED